MEEESQVIYCRVYNSYVRDGGGHCRGVTYADMQEKKKCLVLDLDNTLWGGVVGEDGLENLRLSLTPPGSGYLAFQQAILDHFHRGVMLAINSRNNPEDALLVLRTHPNMLLKEHHFAAMRLNWNDKAQNLRELSEELNIGLDAMVFLDDDAANRSLVRALLPEVETPDLPVDPSDYARFLNAQQYFPSEAITDEDKMRGNLYVTERLRREQEKRYVNKEEFLASLKLELICSEDDSSSLARLVQLTEKTNQFNTNKRPLSEDEIRSYLASPIHHIYQAQLLDIFGDSGIVAFALVEERGREWHIDQFLMSCRVFGRAVEEAFLAFIADRAHSAGAERLSISFTETPKNMPAKAFLDTHFKLHTLMLHKILAVPAWITIRV